MVPEDVRKHLHRRFPDQEEDDEAEVIPIFQTGPVDIIEYDPRKSTMAPKPAFEFVYEGTSSVESKERNRAKIRSRAAMKVFQHQHPTNLSSQRKRREKVSHFKRHEKWQTAQDETIIQPLDHRHQSIVTSNSTTECARTSIKPNSNSNTAPSTLNISMKSSAFGYGFVSSLFRASITESGPACLNSNVVNIQELLHHYVSTFSVESFPIEPLRHLNPMVTHWLPFMLLDPIAFRACLIPSAVDLESRQCRDIGAKILLAESITLLRARLQDPELSCSDHSIAAVLTLAAAEHQKGNETAFWIHLDGLERMISVRGGIDAVASSCLMLAKTVIWMTMVIANKPQYPLFDTWSKSGPHLLQDSVMAACPECHTTPETHGLDDNFLRIFHKIRHVNHVLQIATEESSNFKTQYVPDAISCLLHQIHILEPSTDGGARIACISGCFKLASSLYLLILSGSTHPSPASMMKEYVGRLKVILENDVPFIEIEAEVLLWMLTVSGVAAQGLKERAWFAHYLREIAALLRLVSWDGLRKVLMEFIGIGKSIEHCFKCLWEENVVEEKCGVGRLSVV